MLGSLSKRFLSRTAQMYRNLTLDDVSTEFSVPIESLRTLANNQSNKFKTDGVTNQHNPKFPKERTNEISSNEDSISISIGLNIQNLRNCFVALNREGFKQNLLVSMVKEYPHLMNKSESYIATSLNNWRGCQFGEAFTISLISRYPQLIDVSKTELDNRISSLLESFQNRKSVYKLIELNPSIFFHKWDLVSEKIDYILNVMKLDKSHIIRSTSISKSIFHIKCRHVFLERLGLYKIVKGVKEREKIITLNGSEKFKLSDIVDLSDGDFVKKIAEVSMIEYRTFEQLFERELENRFDFVD